MAIVVVRTLGGFGEGRRGAGWCCPRVCGVCVCKGLGVVVSGGASFCMPSEMPYCVSPFMLPYAGRRAAPSLHVLLLRSTQETLPMPAF